MRALSLCQTCKRHIRVSEPACPFCGAAHTPAPEPAGVTPRGRAGGRAALFLAGAASATGCVDEQPVPVYGVPIDPDASPHVPDGGATRDAQEEMAVPVYGVAVYGVPIDRDGGTDANVCGAQQEPMAAPVYGVPVDAGAARDAGACPSDAGVKDAGFIPLPPYGIPIDLPRDAATPDAARDAEILVMPVYGLALEVEPEPESEE